jgi:hypothetical protein
VTAIVATDIVFLLSVPTASQGYTNGGTPGSSLGKFCSTSVIANGVLDNVFSDITGPENAADQVDYQCIFVLNNTSSGNSMLNTVVWLPLPLYITGSGATTKQLATDSVGFTPKGQSGTPQAAVTTSNLIAPSPISGWVGPSASNAGGLPAGTIPPGYVFAVWIQRTAVAGVPFNNDGLTFEVDFDTMG